MRRTKAPRLLKAGHKCATCPNIIFGSAQKCEECHAKALACQKCGRPHLGQPGTTKLCAECRRGKKGKPRGPANPAWTPEEDAQIREAYATHNAHTIGPRLRELFPTRPKWSLTRRAQVLGAATVRRKEPPWSEEEQKLLEEVSWMSPERIGTKFRERGFQRTTTAIAIRMNRHRLRKGIDSYTAQGLARMLDVDIHKVSKWIDEGWLQADRRKETGGNHDRHHITTAAIQAFLVAHPEQYELSKLERAGSKMWFLELITGGRISEHGEPVPAVAPTATPDTPARTFPLYGERVTLAALADICGRPMAELLRRIDEQGMSVESAAFGPEAPEETAADHPLAREVGEQLRVLMRANRAGVASMVRWTGLPAAFVERLTTGRAPVLLPALVTCVEKLAGEVEIRIRKKTR